MKDIGSLKEITCDITSPIKMKKLEISFDKFALLVGANGTGKTFMLKLTWILSTLCNAKLVNPSTNLNILTQMLLDNTFDEHKFNGMVKVKYDNATMEFETDNGKVINSIAAFKKKVDTPIPAIFMSKDTRLYTDFIKYMKMKKALKISNSIHKFTADNLKDLANLYKIHDINLIEQVLIKITPEYKFNKKLQDTLLSLDRTFFVKSLSATDENIYYTDDKNVTRSVTTLSAGHQAILNMYSVMSMF